MKNIVQVFDALNFKPEELQFASYVAQMHNSGVTVLLIHDTSIGMNQGINMIGGQIYIDEILVDAEDKTAQESKIAANEKALKEWCLSRGVHCDVKVVSGIPAEVARLESRFADLMVLSPLLSFTGEKAVPTAFVKEALVDAECPMLIAAENFHPVGEVVIAYDGSSQSVAAIKQFCYQLQGLCSKRITVLHIIDNGKEGALNEEVNRFENWIAGRFPDYTMITLSGSVQDVLFNYFMEREDQRMMLVAGAFGRGAISRFFRGSATEEVLEKVDIPVFIYHR
jgi:nucleotide-binding universal stress UspA family protein